MISLQKLSRTVERCEGVCYDDTGRRPVGSRGPSRVWEINPSLFYWHTGERSPGYLLYGPLKEVKEKRVAQHILYGLERRPYFQGDGLHKIPLLLEGLLQARIGGLWVIFLHPVYDGYQICSPLNLLLQPPILRRLRTH